jgi:RNA polymerase sigma factor (sigma-70 family)
MNSHPDDAALDAGIRRAREADRELARELDRPASAEGPGAARPGYLRRLAERPPLESDEEAALVGRAQAGDELARAELIDALMPSITAAAAAYRGTGTVQRLELLQEGAVGVLRALERYDATRGVPFWSYASWWVRQAMQQLVSELTGPSVLSDRALRQLARLKDAHGEALREQGREPSRDELAHRAGLGVEQVDQLLAAQRTPRSLDEPVASDEGAIGTFGELLVDPLAEDAYERVLAAMEARELRGLLSRLSDRERAVLRARYGIDVPERTLADIGRQLGLSAERVRQLERRGLAKLAGAAGY